MMRIGWLLLAVGFGLAAGCSSRAKVDTPPTYTALQDLNDLLHAAGDATGRPPKSLADLDRYKTLFPRGYEAVRSGEVVVLWGTPLKGEGEAGKDEAVVAYEKNVPNAGGYVLFSAGTVKKLTSAEFEAAPKTVKK
jgi:hypothetical protein